MANWADNEAPGYDADDLTPHVVPGASLHLRHDKHRGSSCDQPATPGAKLVIWLQKSEKLRAVAATLTSGVTGWRRRSQLHAERVRGRTRCAFPGAALP